MKRLIQCPHCQKTYDTSSMEAGAAFQCHCGATMTTPAPSFDHAADVVRCESCGAPQSEGSHGCRYCGAAFTLQERQLDAVCPKCTTRVSSKAHFCPACGNAIAPSEDAAAITEMPCPACVTEKLYSRRLAEESATVMECHACLGYWLTHDTFREVQKNSLAGGLVLLTIPGAERKKVGSSRPAQEALPTTPRDKPFYRHCPVCRQLMNRKNMSKDQGIILDICRVHGVWFDTDELANLMAWIRDGGLAESRSRDMASMALDQQGVNHRLHDVEKKAPGYVKESLGKPSTEINLADVAKFIFKLIK